ncbi:MAG: transcriptional regulator containing an amidase domain and an AraC-type DNA-binding domain [Mycobacterium sp.]|nr:transcriptional regulator containing an amidase domain and an AraC-type DNA-binding domain [Mycobacterium sp.]
MTRSVVVVGFPGVQALDLVGPFEVFTAVSLCLAADDRGADGYEPVPASVDGRSVDTGTGLSFVTSPLPDPTQPVDTVVLPGGAGVDALRENPEFIGWIQAVTRHARRSARCRRRLRPRRAARTASPRSAR